MAGTIVANTINTDTGLFSTNNAYLGISTAWVNFVGNTSSPTVRSSFNVSSITYVSTGVYTINWATAFADANYCLVGLGQRDSTNTGNLNIYGNASYNSLTTTSAKVVGYDNANNQVGLLTMCVAVLGT